jgi:hypothetical protein
MRERRGLELYKTTQCVKIPVTDSFQPAGDHSESLSGVAGFPVGIVLSRNTLRYSESL